MVIPLTVDPCYSLELKSKILIGLGKTHKKFFLVVGGATKKKKLFSMIETRGGRGVPRPVVRPLKKTFLFVSSLTDSLMCLP